MRRLLLLALLFAALPVTLAAAAQQSLPAPTGYVDDFAHVLSPEATVSLSIQATELHEKTRAQVFVVTVDSLKGEEIKPFANDLYHTWKIGEKGTDRGALILFAIADRKWRIEVGYGLEGILNDAKVGDIGRSVVPELKTADFSSAAEQAFAGVAGVIATDAHVTLTPPPTDAAPAQVLPDTPAETVPDPSPGSGMTGCTVMFYVGCFALLIVLFIIAVLRGRTGGSSGPYVGDVAF